MLDELFNQLIGLEKQKKRRKKKAKRFRRAKRRRGGSFFTMNEKDRADLTEAYGKASRSIWED